jgi:hypothetical protein
MINDQNRLMEGIATFIGGANSSVDPSLLPPNQYSWGINVAVRGGYPRTRPGFKFIKALPNGVIQGASYFKNSSTEELVTLIDGRLYNTQVTLPDSAVLDVTPAEETNNYISRRASFALANNSLVVQDGVNPAIVYTGSNCFRSKSILEELSSYVEVNITIGANNPNINLSSTAGLFPGMLVQTARGIPPNTVIVSINSSTSATLNNNATLTGLASAKFFPPGPLQLDVSIPVGSIMAFGNGRLWVASGNQLYAGDLSGSYAGSEVRFSETQYLNGGGSFSFDSEITGLAFLPGSDTSTGQGDLIVFTRNEIAAIRANIFDRTTWQATAGMQRKMFLGGGCVAADCMIVTNNDIYFRSIDGIRSLVQTVQFSKSANVTLVDSVEADRVINYDTERWTKFSPAAYFDYRAMYGCTPKIQKVNGSSSSYNIVFTKIITQDFNPGVYEGNYPPIYDGEWTGLQVCKFVVGVFDGKQRCFALVCGSDGNNALYEITTDGYFDTVPDGNNGTTALPVSCQVECRRMTFQSPDEIKELLRADLSFSDIYGSVSWSLNFTPDYYPSYFPIQSGQIDFDTETQELETCSPPDLGLGYRTIRTVKPSDSCVIGVSRKARFGYLFQPIVSWVGYAKLAIFKFHASKKDISDLGEC